MAQVCIINSSFRKKSNSTQLGAAVAQGATESGHSVESIDISRLQINPCRDCRGCWAVGRDTCVQKDGMTDLYPSIKKADILIFVSPIYWFNLCGQMKQFIDRCYPLSTDAEGNPGNLALKKFGAVFVYADTDPVNSGCINAIRSFQDMCRFAGIEWLGAVYASAHEENSISKNVKALEQARSYGTKL